MGKVVFEYNREHFKITSIEEIIHNLNNLNISSISLETRELVRGSADLNSFLRSEDSEVVTFFKADYQHPLTIGDDIFGDSKTLYIDPDWYIDNQKFIDNLLCYISQNLNKNEINFHGKCLVNDKLIDSLCKNNNLEKVNFDRYSDDGYSLTYKDYQKFKNSNIKQVNTSSVVEELNDVFDPIVGTNWNKTLIGYYKYEDLDSNKPMSLYINQELTKEEIENLKYINSNIEIQLEERAYSSLEQITKRLKDLNKKNNVILIVRNKNEFNDYILQSDYEEDNVFVKTEGTTLPLKNYLNFEKILYMAVEPAKNLSPFEKYIYAYNITKKFKKYKEKEKGSLESRNLYDVLMNEYMVCVGFSEMFGDLLNKLGIRNMGMTVNVDISYDNIKNFSEQVPLESKPQVLEGHARRYVYIVDEKYDINGFYISDPTWDNDLENDYYNHLAMTDNESTKSNRRLLFSYYSVDELFNVNNISEFYQKINILLDKPGYSNNLNALIDGLLRRIENLDLEFIKDLKEKYKYLLNGKWDWPKDNGDLIYDLGNYIVNHVNNEISGTTIMSAVENIYRQIYVMSEEELQLEMNKVIEQNKIRQEKVFPKFYKINEDGSKELIVNLENKFDIENADTKSL